MKAPLLSSIYNELLYIFEFGDKIRQGVLTSGSGATKTPHGDESPVANLYHVCLNCSSRLIISAAKSSEISRKPSSLVRAMYPPCHHWARVPWHFPNACRSQKLESHYRSYMPISNLSEGRAHFIDNEASKIGILVQLPRSISFRQPIMRIKTRSSNRADFSPKDEKVTTFRWHRHLKEAVGTMPLQIIIILPEPCQSV